jgi:DNA-binding CsgD family transcriptional regulator
MEVSSELAVTKATHVSVLRPAFDVVPAALRIEAFPTHANVSRVPSASSAAARWEDLVQGRLVIVHHAAGEFDVSLTVEFRREAAEPCDPAAAAMMRRILTGCAQKVMAYELDVAASTASLRAGKALKAFGLKMTTRRAPPALAMLAASHATSANYSPQGYHELPTGKPDQLELRMPRPEGRLRRYLSPAEYAVLKAIVEGHSYREVGALLNRSPRTVANQLRSISTKVGVCGRLQLINLAIKLSLNPTR